MWNCKFGAKSGGYLRSDPLRCLLITGYQANINQISKMPQASKWLCGISVYFYLFLSVSVSFYCFSVYGRITFPAFVSFSAMVYIFVTVPTAGSFSP